jgi:hypothetical protein
MITEIASYITANRKELGLPPEPVNKMNFFKIGGNPWGQGRINFLAFHADDTEPVLFIKTMREPDKDESLRHEYEIVTKLALYEKLAPFLPLPIHMVNLSGRDVIIQNACHGKRMLSTLSRSPVLYFQKDTIVGNFTRALEFITLFTICGKRDVDIDAFRQMITEPMTTFYQEYNHSKEHVTALVKLLDRITDEMGSDPVITTLHGDYSATNIFLGSDNHMKIIDWETATENGLPFFDLFYFMSKYIHNLKILPKNRWRRVRSAYFDKNWLSKVIRQTVEEYCRRTGYSIELARLVFPLHFFNKARIKYSMRGRGPAQPWMELFEFSLHNLDKLRF